MQTNDYLKIVDLNPTTGTPVLDPRDDHALCDFGFAAESQHLFLAQFSGSTSCRVLYSFDTDHNLGGTPPLPALPSPGNVTPHGVFFTIGGPPATMEAKYERSHTRRSVRLWIDPATPPTTGQIVQIVVKAWSEQ